MTVIQLVENIIADDFKNPVQNDTNIAAAKTLQTRKKSRLRD
jgi:hypothetical protein